MYSKTTLVFGTTTVSGLKICLLVRPLYTRTTCIILKNPKEGGKSSVLLLWQSSRSCTYCMYTMEITWKSRKWRLYGIFSVKIKRLLTLDLISWKKFWKFRFLRLRYFFRENKTVVNFCYLRFHGKDSENSENDAFYDYVIFSVKIERLLTFAMFDFTEKSRKWRFSRLRYFFRENKTAVANVCYIWFHRNFSQSRSPLLWFDYISQFKKIRQNGFDLTKIFRWNCSKFGN